MSSRPLPNSYSSVQNRPELLASLQCYTVGDEHLVPGLINLFLQAVSDEVSCLREALGDHNLRKVREAVQRLYGTTVNFRSPAMAITRSLMDGMARRGDMPGVALNLAIFELDFQVERESLLEECGRLAMSSRATERSP